MRTTVTLDRDLERILRETALRTHKPFKKVLNDTLRAGIELAAPDGKVEPFIVRARPMHLRAGYDPAGFNRLADDLEAEAFLEMTRKLIERSQ
ncbi:MAG: antitoxin [Verrucomicrobia bacterium]|nr:MAG: antitoxin [Verrucomicrobiota bacterium]